MMKKPKNLERYKDLPDEHLVDYRQMGLIFGVDDRSITSLIHKGWLPAHDKKKKVVQVSFGGQKKTRRKHFWTLGSLRAI